LGDTDLGTVAVGPAAGAWRAEGIGEGFTGLGGVGGWSGAATGFVTGGVAATGRTTAGRTGGAGCDTGDGVAACGGAIVGKGVPQKPQNLLPMGKDLWHFGQDTSAGGEAIGGCDTGTLGIATGPVVSKAVSMTPDACKGLPQRAHASEVPGFIFPQDGHRIYRIVPCSFASALIFVPNSWLRKS